MEKDLELEKSFKEENEEIERLENQKQYSYKALDAGFTLEQGIFIEEIIDEIFERFEEVKNALQNM